MNVYLHLLWSIYAEFHRINQVDKFVNGLNRGEDEEIDLGVLYSQTITLISATL